MLKKRPLICISCRYGEFGSRQFPDKTPTWDGWDFVFNNFKSDYDYLVVLDDLHRHVTLNCSRKNTLHIATEPPTMYQYKPEYLRNFGAVITQDPEVDHPRRICSHGGLSWAVGGVAQMGLAELKTMFNTPKTKLVSVITSTKAFSEGHRNRLNFALKLKDHFGDRLDFFGHGFNYIDDKVKALQDYRFHIALENSKHDHYFTEKLSDSVLAGAYPIYHGCPNLGEYIPEKSFLAIDIDDFEGSVKAIEQAIAEDYDKIYRGELTKARDQIMYEHNLFPLIIKTI